MHIHLYIMYIVAYDILTSLHSQLLTLLNVLRHILKYRQSFLWYRQVRGYRNRKWSLV